MQLLWLPSRSLVSSTLTSTRESSALRPSHHLAFSDTQLTTFCSTCILSISCTSQLMGCCKTQRYHLNIAKATSIYTVWIQILAMILYHFYRPHLLFRGGDVNSDRHRSLLKTRQYDAVTNLTGFYPEQGYHTHCHPCTGCTERKDIFH